MTTAYYTILGERDATSSPVSATLATRRFSPPAALGSSFFNRVIRLREMNRMQRKKVLRGKDTRGEVL